jgi:MFS family permease
MDDLQKIGRRTTLILFAQQGLASAAFIAAATLNSIVGAQLAGNASFAGLPAATVLLSGALAAGGWGFINEALGRRGGLVLGLLLGVLGLGVAFFAVASASFAAFLVGMMLTGFGWSAVQLARFAAADVNPPQARGRAISYVVLGGTVGSVVGPLMTGPAGRFFQAATGDELAGGYAVGSALFLLSAIIVFLGLRPDPRDVGRKISALHPSSGVNGTSAGEGEDGTARRARDIFRQPAAAVALAAMVVGQLVMVMVMVITALHMKDHDHTLGAISVVISAHTFGMYAFSVFSGQLVDRWGRGPTILAGSATLVLASVAATMSPDVLPLGVALFFLGLGWNFCYVGGSTLLADQLSPPERARTQGLNDLMVGFASATGSLSSGVIFAAVGYATMGHISAVLALVPFVATALWFRRRPRPAQAVS